MVGSPLWVPRSHQPERLQHRCLRKHHGLADNNSRYVFSLNPRGQRSHRFHCVHIKASAASRHRLFCVEVSASMPFFVTPSLHLYGLCHKNTSDFMKASPNPGQGQKSPKILFPSKVVPYYPAGPGSGTSPFGSII